MGTYHLYGALLAWIVTGILLAVLGLVLRILYAEEMHHSQMQDGQGLSLFCGKTGSHQCMLRHIGFRRECLKRRGWKVMSSKLSVPLYSCGRLHVSPGTAHWKTAGLTVTVSFVVIPEQILHRWSDASH